MNKGLHSCSEEGLDWEWQEWLNSVRSVCAAGTNTQDSETLNELWSLSAKRNNPHLSHIPLGKGERRVWAFPPPPLAGNRASGGAHKQAGKLGEGISCVLPQSYAQTKAVGLAVVREL